MADDTRVVQMQFDNKDFEKNISTSQKSLERFKKSLNFDTATKGLADFGKQLGSLTFNTLADNIQKLTDKFTGFGNVAEYVISRIRGKLEGLADRALGFMESITTGQISAGFEKYETLNKSVQTLKSATQKDEKEIYDILERLNKYTDETSYDFSQGVTSISQLVSSGAATMEQAEKVVEGFYNYAAKAGADTTTAANALNYSMVQAFQRGYLDWSNAKELSGRSLLTLDFKEQLLETAVELGTVTKEGEKYYVQSKKGTKAKKIEVNTTNLFNDSLQQQWVTSKVLRATLTKYGDTTTEFGEQAFAAAQRCTTFTDALNAWKDMMSTGWMTAYRTVFGDLGEAMALFSGLCNKVSDSLDGLITPINGVLNAWRSVGGRDNLWGMLFGEIEDPDGETLFEGAYGVLDIISQVGDMISGAFWETFMNLIPKEEQNRMLNYVNSQFKQLGLEKPFESFAEMYNSDWAKEHGIHEGLFGGVLQGMTEDIQNFVKGIHDWFSEVDDNGVSRIEKIQNVMNAVGRTIAFIFEIFGGIGHFFSLIAKQLEPSADAIGDLLSAIGLRVIDAENDVSNGGGITSFFENLAAILQPVTGIINEVVVALTGLIGSLFGSETVSKGAQTTFQAIGETIKKVFGKIAEILRPATDFLKETFEIIGTLIRSGFDERSMEYARQRITRAFSKLWDGIKSIVSPVIEKIGTLLSLLWTTVKEKITAFFNDENSIGYKILQPIKNIFGPIWGTIKEMFAKVRDALTGAGKDAEQGGKTIFQTIGSIFSPLLEKLKTVNLWTVAKALLGGIAAVKLIGLLGKGKKLFGGLSDLVQQIQDPIGWLKESFFGAKNAEAGFTDKMWTFAKSMGILVGVMAVIGNMSWEQVARALVGLGGILLELVGYMALLKLLKVDGSSLRGFAMFAASIGILVFSMQSFVNMSWDQFGKMMAGLGGVLLELVVIMGLMKLLNINTKVLGSFVGFAVSLTLLVLTLKTFANMSWDQFGKMMAGLGGVLLELVGFMLLTSYLPIGTGQLGSFIRFALSLGLLVVILQTLANKSWEQIAKMLVGMGGILLELVGFLELLKAFNIDVQRLSSLSVFAGILSGLIGVLQPLSNFSMTGILKMLVGMGGILLELAVFTRIMKSFDTSGADLAAILVLAVSISIFLATLKPLAEYSWEDIGKMVASLGVLILEIVGFMALTSGIKRINKKSFGMMLAAAVSISLIAFTFSKALARVKGMKWETITSFAIGLSAVMLAFAGAIAILSKVDFAGGIKSILLLSAAILAISGVLTIALPLVGKGIGGGIEEIAGYLALAGNSISKFANSMNGVGDLESVKSKIETLVEIVKSLNGVRGYSDDISAFSAMLFELGVGIGLMDYSMSEVGNPENSNGIKMMEKVLEMKDRLAEFDSTVSGYSISGKFNSLGAGLKRFAEDTEGIEFDEEESQGFGLLQKLTDMATGFDLISKTDFSLISGKLAELGGGMKLYAEGAGLVKGLEEGGGNVPDVTAATELLGQIVAQLGGETGEFTLPTLPPVGDENTEGSISAFGAQLVALGGGLSNFANACNGIDESKIKIGLSALDFLLDIKTRLTSNLVEAVTFFGDNGLDATSLAAFGSDITALAGGLSDFVMASQGIGDEAQKGLDALDYFMALKEKLAGKHEEILGFVSEWNAGQSEDDKITVESIGSFSSFGVEIGALGKALSSFANDVSFDTDVEEKFNNGIATLDFLVTLRSRMPYIGGIKQFIEGYQETFKELAKDIIDLGGSIASFGDDIVGSPGFKDNQSIEQVKAAVGVVESLVSILSNLGTLWGAFSGPHSENFMGDALTYSSYYSTFIKTFLQNLEEMDGLETKSTGQPFQKFTKKLAAILINFKAALGEMDPQEAVTASQILNNVSQAISNLIAVSQTAGEEGSQVDFSEIGLNIAAGVALGIESGTNQVIAAAVSMVQQAKAAAMSAADEHSPSRVFMEIGEYMSLGTAIGIGNKSQSVEEAATGMANDAINEASKTMALITSLMSQDVEANPTITPVLDLSNITAGTATMNDLLNQDHDVSLTADGNRYARSAVPVTDQSTKAYVGPDLSMIQASIDSLGSRIDAMGNKIASMQIVLNTGSLVGAVTHGVNSNIGRQATYGRRRN